MVSSRLVESDSERGRDGSLVLLRLSFNLGRRNTADSSMCFPSREDNIPLEIIQIASLGLYFPRASLHRARTDKPQGMLLTFRLMTLQKQAGYREKKDLTL